MFDLHPWQWLLAFLGAFLVGLSKTGIVGVGIVVVSIFANILPAKQSVGVVLPLLICGDVIAVLAYRHHARWQHLWRLFPWTALGVVLGFLIMDGIDDWGVAKLTGTILISLVAIHLWRYHRSAGEIPTHVSFALTMGVLAGFTTMVSNAAGPIMILYLLAMRLPKMEFLGTSAFFFLVMNVFKVPFSVQLGIITADSLFFNLQLGAFVIAGALVGRVIIGYIDQKLFERIALAFTILAAFRLLLA